MLARRSARSSLAATWIIPLRPASSAQSNSRTARSPSTGGRVAFDRWVLLERAIAGFERPVERGREELPLRLMRHSPRRRSSGSILSGSRRLRSKVTPRLSAAQKSRSADTSTVAPAAPLRGRTQERTVPVGVPGRAHRAFCSLCHPESGKRDGGRSSAVYAGGVLPLCLEASVGCCIVRGARALSGWASAQEGNSHGGRKDALAIPSRPERRRRDPHSGGGGRLQC